MNEKVPLSFYKLRASFSASTVLAPPIFDQGFSFFFCSLKHIHNLTANETSILGDPSVLSSEVKGRNSYPGSRFMAEGLGFWLKRLAEGKTWRM